MMDRKLRTRTAARVCAAVLCACVAAAFFGCKKDPVELAWTFAGGASIHSTPLVTKEVLVFGNEDGAVVAIDKGTGTYKWRFNASMNVISSPKTWAGKYYFGSTNHSFYAIDNQGREVWKFATQRPIKSDPAIENGIAYLTSYDGHVYALNAETRELVWMFPPRPSPVPPPEDGTEPAPPTEPPLVVGEFSYSSPVIANGVLFVGNIDGNVYAINTADGKLKWKFQTEGGKESGGVTSSPWVEDGVVYVGCKDSNIYALDAATGKKLWAHKTGGWVHSSPRVKDGVVYCGSEDKNLYALDAKTGALKGKFPAAGPVTAYPAFFKNYVITAGGQGDGTVYVLDRATLQPIYKFKTAGKIEADPVVDGNMLYVASFDKMLYAFRFNEK